MVLSGERHRTCKANGFADAEYWARSKSNETPAWLPVLTTVIAECEGGDLSVFVGIISDTHGLLRPQAVSMLGGVEYILHAGDVGDDTILIELRKVAPVSAIRGNVDRVGLCAELPPTQVVDLEGTLFYMVHSLRDLDLKPEAAGISMVVSGHTHKASIEIRNGVIYLNPGSAGPRRFSLPTTIALVRTRPELRAEILTLDP